MQIENDGKGKHMSFTATIELPLTGAANAYGQFSGEITGWGATAEEAKQNALETAKAMSLAVAEAALDAVHFPTSGQSR